MCYWSAFLELPSLGNTGVEVGRNCCTPTQGVLHHIMWGLGDKQWWAWFCLFLGQQGVYAVIALLERSADNHHQEWRCLKQLQPCQSSISSMVSREDTLWIASVDATLLSMSLKVSLFIKMKHQHLNHRFISCVYDRLLRWLGHGSYQMGYIACVKQMAISG